MGIIDFYKGVLSAAGCSVDSYGQIHIDSMGESSPLTITGKQAVLPTKDILANPNWEQQIAFHPLCESILAKESVVMKRFRGLTITRVNVIAMILMQDLMNIAIDADRRKRLSPDQAEYLMLLPKADGKTINALGDLVRTLDPKLVSKRLVSIYVSKSKGKVLDGVDYKRTAIVSFPVMDGKQEAGNELLKVNMGSQKNKASILALFEYLFPNCDQENTYSFGSNDMSVPGIHSYLGALAKIYERLNSILDLFGDVLENPEELTTDLTWVDGLSSLKKFRALVPMLPGNAGDPVDGDDEQEQDIAPDAPKAAPASTVRRQIAYPADEPAPTAAAAPVTAPASTAKPQGSSLPSWKDKLASSIAANEVHVPMYHQEPPAPPAGYYQAPPPQGYYQQPPPPQHYAPPPPQGYYQQPTQSPGRNRHQAEQAQQYYHQQQQYYQQQAPQHYAPPPPQGYYQQPPVYPQGHNYPPQGGYRR